MHLCGGKVRNVAVFAKADNCEKEKNLPPCHRHIKTNCCDDEKIIHEGDDFKGALNHFNLDAPHSLDLHHPFVLISEIIPSAPTSRIHFHNYDPPLGSPDLILQHHVFLI
jgi:hypothetical protein